jgi:hypothetical protein
VLASRSDGRRGGRERGQVDRVEIAIGHFRQGRGDLGDPTRGIEQPRDRGPTRLRGE